MDSLTLFSLQKKTLLITGASSGIGRQCAISCAKAGARVIISGQDNKRLEDCLRALKGTGHMAFPLNITNETALLELMDDLKSKELSIDGIINAAGISTTLPFRNTNPEKMQHFFNTNVIGAMNLSRLVIKNSLMNKKGGSLIFISSVMGVNGETGKTLYGMSKGALIAGVKSLAVELAAKNIRVNAVSPGVVQSPMSEKAIYSRDENALQKIIAMHPLGLGKPGDIAYACIYLLSDASRWVTGTNLIIDGGYTAR